VKNTEKATFDANFWLNGLEIMSDATVY